MEKKFSLERVQGTPVLTEELLSDLRRVASEVNGTIITQRVYQKFGKYASTTIRRRYGTWNKAIKAAGLVEANIVNYTDDALFENIMRLWETFGRQPRLAELARPPSTISHGPYKRRFRSWTSALESFVEYANAKEIVATTADISAAKNRTSRDPSLRLRFQVLKRDDFKCRACGASPATTPGLQLCVDHIIPWSKGGETMLENLQTLCAKCNLGKSNVF